ncbi:hypothetical protein VNO78_09940 [Psophocarpus tetragonolobus]|uniref:Uncharacterized protein n=1 Tax=Psophocarpus tetragonolobus TaxID=3891 RepID=A0AAN9XLS5_PSOTE
MKDRNPPSHLSSKKNLRGGRGEDLAAVDIVELEVDIVDLVALKVNLIEASRDHVVAAPHEVVIVARIAPHKVVVIASIDKSCGPFWNLLSLIFSVEESLEKTKRRSISS